jgi:hypothetical protein
MVEEAGRDNESDPSVFSMRVGPCLAGPQASRGVAKRVVRRATDATADNPARKEERRKDWRMSYLRSCWTRENRVLDLG